MALPFRFRWSELTAMALSQEDADDNLSSVGGGTYVALAKKNTHKDIE